MNEINPKYENTPAIIYNESKSRILIQGVIKSKIINPLDFDTMRFDSNLKYFLIGTLRE
jgi:hypothetical protein